MNVRYVHTNLIAEDWRALARFYETVFDCLPVPPERNLAGQWLEQGTGVPDAALQGIHLRLPGYGEKGPTLEIFQYNHHAERYRTAINRPGFGHIAFQVDDMPRARKAVLDGGGADYGKQVSLQVPGAGTVTFIYMTDPEGNILELQQWS